VSPTPRPWLRPALWISAIIALVAAVLAFEIDSTRPTRSAVRTYAELVTAANHNDPEAARRLCTARYLSRHQLKRADEGGIVGLPRNIHKNFRAWRHGANVWLCPTDRVGPIYQFIPEGGRWLFDGPVGLLRAGGRIELFEEEPSAP
jgi:hypothetical protein